MTIHPNHLDRRCDIWLNHEECVGYRNTPAFQSAYRQYHGQGYRICVYLGGSEPLLPNVTALLDWQGLV